MCPPNQKYFITYHLYHSIMRGLTTPPWQRYVIYEWSLTSIGLCWLKRADRWKEKGKKTVQHILNFNKKSRNIYIFVTQPLNVILRAEVIHQKKRQIIVLIFVEPSEQLNVNMIIGTKKAFHIWKQWVQNARNVKTCKINCQFVLILLERLSFVFRFSQRLHFHEFLRHDFCDWYLV